MVQWVAPEDLGIMCPICGTGENQKKGKKKGAKPSDNSLWQSQIPLDFGTWEKQTKVSSNVVARWGWWGLGIKKFCKGLTLKWNMPIRGAKRHTGLFRSKKQTQLGGVTSNVLPLARKEKRKGNWLRDS